MRRDAAVRELLAEYGRPDFHEQFLRLLNGAAMDQQQVAQHLGAVTAAFDAARIVRTTPYRFGADISDAARPLAADGSRELIEAASTVRQSSGSLPRSLAAGISSLPLWRKHGA